MKAILVLLLAALTLGLAGTAAATTCELEHPGEPPAADHPGEPVHPPATTPPADHTCTPTGAGKDGHPGNDDCAPVTVPPSVVTVPTPPVVITVERIVEKLVPGPERVVTKVVKVKSKPKIVRRVITKTKTKIVYRDRIKCPPYTKLVHGTCMVPGKG